MEFWTFLQGTGARTRSSDKNDGDWVYRAVKARVIAYEFPQGERIYLQPIADEFGISTWPVRQAFDRLAQNGLVIKAPRKGYYAPTLTEPKVSGNYLVTKHFLALGLETLSAKPMLDLPDRESIGAILKALNRHEEPDAKLLAVYTGELFRTLAVITGHSATVFAIKYTNDHLFYVRTLEANLIDTVRDDLVYFCKLLRAGEYDELALAIRDYHEQRFALLSELMDLMRPYQSANR